MRCIMVLSTIVALSLSTMSVLAQCQVPDKEGVASLSAPEFSPYAGREFPTRVFWGDTHLHTAISVDAGTMCRVGQEEAFRFAR